MEEKSRNSSGSRHKAVAQSVAQQEQQEMQYVQRRNDTYHYNRRAPTGIKPGTNLALADGKDLSIGANGYFRFALKTKDAREAARRANCWTVLIDAAIKAHHEAIQRIRNYRKQATVTVTDEEMAPPTPEQIQSAADQMYATLLAADEHTHQVAIDAALAALEACSSGVNDIPIEEDQWRDPDRFQWNAADFPSTSIRGDVELLRQIVPLFNFYLYQNSGRVVTTTAELNASYFPFVTAFRRYLSALERRRKGEDAPTPSIASQSSAVTTPQPTKASFAAMTVTQAWEGFKSEKIALGTQDGVKGGWKDGEDTALRDYWPHIRAFIELVGDLVITEVTADHADRFQRHVLTSPDGGKARNREKRLQRAGAIFRWAKGKRLISDAFSEFFRYPGKIQENPYQQFDADDLSALFESEDYQNHKFNAAWEYWLPLLALFSGSRLNELCQLTQTDIGEHEGIRTISILDEEYGNDRSASKRLKTTSSRRIVPIHSMLIKLGFLGYVESIPEGSRLFPELPEDPARPGNYAPRASEWFTQYRRKCGVGNTKERSRKVFHSFRPTLISVLRKKNVPKDRRTRLAGHEYSDTQDTHYTGDEVLTMFDFATLKADIELATFDVNFTPYRPR